MIHTLDSVLLPPSGPATTALDMGFLYFYGAAEQTDSVAALNDSDSLTIFIPTDQAFISVGGNLADLFPEELASVVRFHVVPGQTLYTTNLTDGDTLSTLADTTYDSGIDVSVNEDDGALYVSNARVITPNILLANGVAHLIDQTLNVQEDDANYLYSYTAPGANGVGISGFEDAESATIPALTSGLPTPTSAFTPTATFTAVSGAAREIAGSPWTFLAVVYALLMAVA